MSTESVRKQDRARQEAAELIVLANTAGLNLVAYARFAAQVGNSDDARLLAECFVYGNEATLKRHWPTTRGDIGAKYLASLLQAYRSEVRAIATASVK